ncbi:MAG: hypothetical protein FJZ16_08035 [Candidatus Omnitrophica bacterium]|nr:hypothetical protein [Candidatus Omnitrophota bacterium]
MKKFIVFLCICLFLDGCATTGEANRYYLKEKLPPKNINEVEVLKEKPTRPYIVIADFQASYATVKHMRKRAAEIGADAVIVTHTGGWYSYDEVWAENDRYSNSYTELIGTAIKYKTE